MYAIAAEDCEVLLIRKKDFMGLLDEFTDVNQEVRALATYRLEKHEDELNYAKKQNHKLDTNLYMHHAYIYIYRFNEMKGQVVNLFNYNFLEQLAKKTDKNAKQRKRKSRAINLPVISEKDRLASLIKKSRSSGNLLEDEQNESKLLDSQEPIRRKSKLHPLMSKLSGQVLPLPSIKIIEKKLSKKDSLKGLEPQSAHELIRTPKPLFFESEALNTIVTTNEELTENSESSSSNSSESGGTSTITKSPTMQGSENMETYPLEQTFNKGNGTYQPEIKRNETFGDAINAYKPEENGSDHSILRIAIENQKKEAEIKKRTKRHLKNFNHLTASAPINLINTEEIVERLETEEILEDSDNFSRDEETKSPLDTSPSVQIPESERALLPTPPKNYNKSTPADLFMAQGVEIQVIDNLTRNWRNSCLFQPYNSEPEILSGEYTYNPEEDRSVVTQIGRNTNTQNSKYKIPAGLGPPKYAFGVNEDSAEIYINRKLSSFNKRPKTKNIKKRPKKSTRPTTPNIKLTNRELASIMGNTAHKRKKKYNIYGMESLDSREAGTPVHRKRIITSKRKERSISPFYRETRDNREIQGEVINATPMNRKPQFHPMQPILNDEFGGGEMTESGNATPTVRLDLTNKKAIWSMEKMIEGLKIVMETQGAVFTTVKLVERQVRSYRKQFDNIEDKCNIVISRVNRIHL